MSECPEAVIGGGHEPVCARCGQDLGTRGPVDWPARLRAAAAVAEREGLVRSADELRALAQRWQDAPSPESIEAIGRALLGEVDR